MPVETNHIQTTNKIYCNFKPVKAVVSFNANHYNTFCIKCPFFRGTAQGQGIECGYFDGTNIPISVIDTPKAVQELATRMKTFKPKGAAHQELVFPKTAFEGIDKTYIIRRNTKKVGTLVFGDEIALELDSQNTKLQQLIANSLVNGSNGARVGDIQYPEIVLQMLEDKGYNISSEQIKIKSTVSNLLEVLT